jgi:hypothetical protein
MAIPLLNRHSHAFIHSGQNQHFTWKKGKSNSQTCNGKIGLDVKFQQQKSINRQLFNAGYLVT